MAGHWQHVVLQRGTVEANKVLILLSRKLRFDETDMQI